MKGAESELLREREREKERRERIRRSRWKKSGFISLFTMRNGRFEQGGDSQTRLGTLEKKQKNFSERIKETFIKQLEPSDF